MSVLFLSYLTSPWPLILRPRVGSSLANIALTRTVRTQSLALEMFFCTVLPIWLIHCANTPLVHPTRDALRMQVNLCTVYPFAVQWRAFSIVCFTWSLETITVYTLQLIGMFLFVDIFQVSLNAIVVERTLYMWTQYIAFSLLITYISMLVWIKEMKRTIGRLIHLLSAWSYCDSYGSLYINSLKPSKLKKVYHIVA